MNQHGWLLTLAMAAVWALAPAPALAQGAQATSCVSCHSNPEFRVTNKKLFDYYRNWNQSVHNQEGVTCTDCHGGNPNARTKEAAHGGAEMGAASAGSPVNYRNIPQTCATCHDDIYARYRESRHFRQLLAAKEEQRGPNCVTCHGSVNLQVLNVNNIAGTCQHCHNERTGNHPDIPARAEQVLSEFLSIHRFYRYIMLRGAKVEKQEILDQIERQTKALMIDWHTFDLVAIEKRTRQFVTYLKEKRLEIRESRARNP